MTDLPTQIHNFNGPPIIDSLKSFYEKPNSEIEKLSMQQMTVTRRDQAIFIQSQLVTIIIGDETRFESLSAEHGTRVTTRK